MCGVLAFRRPIRLDLAARAAQRVPKQAALETHHRMDFDLNEWFKLLLRWGHVFASILWVGTTYYFTWLDGRFSELESAAKNGEKEGAQLERRIWMVHSGGFYVVEKQKVPSPMPEKLHWFRWEAALTWLT